MNIIDNKILVVGLDGASLNYVLPWVKENQLPNIQRLFENKIIYNLETVLPPLTPPAWTTLVTGKNPGKHGIYDFFKTKINTYEKELVSSLDISAKCIWDYASDAGFVSVVLNVPVTHPAKKINGVLIPGYLASEPPKCYPENIINKMKDKIGDYRIYDDSEIKHVNKKTVLSGFLTLIKMRRDAAIYLVKEYNPDFIFIQFQRTDQAFHKGLSEKMILSLYKSIDTCIGEIINLIGKNKCNTFLVSDHGIGKSSYTFHVGSWLFHEGLLIRKVGKLPSFYEKKKDIINSKPSITIEGLLQRFFKLIDLTRAQRFPVIFIINHMQEWLLRSGRKYGIDYEKSKAYVDLSDGYGIRINLKGREPLGVIKSSNECQQLINTIIKKLQKIRGPNGELVFNKVLKSNKYYYGEKISLAPDIILMPNKNYTLSTSIKLDLFGRSETHQHTMYGLLIAKGPNIRKGDIIPPDLPKAKITDVAPTILHLMNIPIPRDIDGRVLKELFNV